MAIKASQVKELRDKTGVGMMECKKALTETDGDLEKAVIYLRERGMSRAAKKAGRVTAEGVVEVMVNSDSTAGVALEINCETDFVSKNEDFIQFSKDVAKIALENQVNDIEELKKLDLNGTPIGDQLSALIAKIGENLNLRRVSTLAAQNGVVTAYSHMGGKIGALVMLEGATSSAVSELGKDLAMHVAAASPRFLISDEVTAEELEVEKDLARKKLIEQGKPEAMIDKILGGVINKFYKEVCLVEQAFIKDPKSSVKALVKQNGEGSELTAYTRFQLGDGIEKKKEDFAAEVAAAVES